MRISDWSSDVCSSDLLRPSFPNHRRLRHVKSSILMICFLRYAQAMSINRIAFYHLETLLWIARLGTFAAAAERLNTTQPAISARVRELENHLGTVLFRREGRTMTLTPAGRDLEIGRAHV